MAFDPELGKQLQFSAEDLEANRQGKLSSVQKHKLNRDACVGGITIAVFAVIFVVMGLITIFVESILGLVVVVVGLWMGYFGWRYVRRTLSSKHVQSYTGHVKSVGVLHRAGNIIYTDEHNFHIAYRTFLVPNLSGKMFTFYFVAPQMLLSVEEVSDTSSPPHQAAEVPASNAVQD